MTKASVSVQDQVTKLLEAYQQGRISEEVYQKNLDRLMKAVVQDSAGPAAQSPGATESPKPESKIPQSPKKATVTPARPRPEQARPAPQEGEPARPASTLPTCRRCGSADLRICSDGSGTCNGCGKTFFNLTGKPELIMKVEPRAKPLPGPPEKQQAPQPYQQPQYAWQAQPPGQYSGQAQQYPLPPPQYAQPPLQQPQAPAAGYAPPKQYAAYRVAPPPGMAYEQGPKCPACASNNIQFYPDGSGTCNYCGKGFQGLGSLQTTGSELWNATQRQESALSIIPVMEPANTKKGMDLCGKGLKIIFWCTLLEFILIVPALIVSYIGNTFMLWVGMSGILGIVALVGLVIALIGIYLLNAGKREFRGMRPMLDRGTACIMASVIMLVVVPVLYYIMNPFGFIWEGVVFDDDVLAALFLFLIILLAIEIAAQVLLAYGFSVAPSELVSDFRKKDLRDGFKAIVISYVIAISIPIMLFLMALMFQEPSGGAVFTALIVAIVMAIISAVFFLSGLKSIAETYEGGVY